MLRLTFEGDGLGEMEAPQPAGSVRLLVPGPDSEELIMPTWTGNEFLLPDGSRPVLRTFTPLRFDSDADSLDLEIVRHPGGAVSAWAERAAQGSAAAISGPARGIEIDPSVERFVLLGDETAMPAITQLLEALPASAAVDVHIEVIADAARIEIPEHPRRQLTWHINDAATPGAHLADVARGLELGAADHVWAAGEAASMQAIRKHLFNERGLDRSQATIRGYWKPDRA
jgi:NADPH-dependent ferric siderophore reductase